jgi:hypothetical protein
MNFCDRGHKGTLDHVQNFSLGNHAMRKIINGKSYDTETADFICDISGYGGTLSHSDFRFEDTDLYRTQKGAWFIAGKGGALSRWGKPYGNNGHIGGDGIRLVTEDEAKTLVEEFVSDEYDEYFDAEEA